MTDYETILGRTSIKTLFLLVLPTRDGKAGSEYQKIARFT